MNPQLRRAAKACLLSTVTGAILVPCHTVLAQSAARIMHADAEEAAGPEPAPLNTLGPASPMPLRGERSATTAARKPALPKGKQTVKSRLGSAAARSAAVKPATRSDAPRAAIGPSRTGTENIEQAAAQVRPVPYGSPYSPQASANAFDGHQAAGQSAPMSPVERELKELYRKNGRQMPEMNMQEYAPPATQGAPAQASGQPYSGRGTPAPFHRPAIRASKPNFFERIFGFGRARHKNGAPTRNSPPANYGQPPAQGYASPGQRPAPQAPGYQPPGQTAPAPGNAAASQAPPLAPFRPNGMIANPSPAQQPSAYPAMREPAPLAPAGEAVPPTRQPGATAFPNRDPQVLIDESKLQDDSESLELSPDDDATRKRQGPQILPNKSSEPVSESPYTGLTINPHETENGIARTEELEKPVDGNLGGTPQTPEKAPGSSPQSAGSTGNSVLKHPLADTPQSAAPATKSALPDDDDEMLDLDDDDDDDDEKDGAPAKSADDETMSIPGEEETVFPRAAGADQSRTTPAATTPADKDREAIAKKLASSRALKGFKGFCPVLLKDQRRLVEADAQFTTEHDGKVYTFSSREAKQAFDANPQKYAPAKGGKDVVRLAGGDNASEGSLEHAAWYRGKLFLFSSAETRREFIDAPSRFSVAD